MAQADAVALPPITTDKIVVKDHSLYGRSAYAAQPIKAGSLVICEEPLLFHEVSNENKVLLGMLRQLQQYVKNHPEISKDATMIHAEDWASACGFWLAFCRASEAVQQQVLQDMFSNPQGGDVDRTAPLRRTAVQAQVLAGMAPEFTKILKIFAAVAAKDGAPAADAKEASSDPELIRKLLLATELNVHHMGSSGAIYAQGSKLAHTCDSPNTTYMSCKGRGCFIATRDIAAGELLTTTYLPAELHIASVFARKNYLWDTFSFDCACPRCTSQIDKFSSLPCSRCATSETARDDKGFLPVSLLAAASDSNSSSSEGELPCGLLQFDPRKADSTTLREHYVGNDDHGCCGCGHDHDHNHDHDHGHKHEHGSRSAAAAAGAGENGEGSSTAAAAGAGKNGAAASTVAAAALATPWQCTKCGLQLPDRDLDLIGDYPIVREAATRIEKWAFGSVMTFDPQVKEHQHRLEMITMLLGPYHWSVHAMRGRMSDYFCTVVRSVVASMMQHPQGKVQTEHMEFLQKAVAGLAMNTNSTWKWLTGVVGYTEQVAAYTVGAYLIRYACALLESAAYFRMNPKVANAYAELIGTMQALADDLLEKAQPALERFRSWHESGALPDHHPLVRNVDVTQTLVARTSAASLAVGGSGSGSSGGLSMEKLQEFLPAAGGNSKAAVSSSNSSSSGSKAKGKKKAGVKK